MQAITNSNNQIIQGIEDYMRKCGGGYSDWYAGIASEPRARLFSDHNVAENGAWIYHDCGSDSVARDIEDYFLNQGCQGGPGGGDYTTHYVYAYKVGPNTVE